MPGETLSISDSPSDPSTAAQPDAPVTVQLTIVRSEPLAEPLDDEPAVAADAALDEEPPETLSGVIAHHLDELRTRDADGEVLDLVTYELRRLTGRRNVRALRGRHSA